MRLTIPDVAREAGVSTATVDRVLNGRPGVGARTRHRVLRAAHRLGYLVPEVDLPSPPPAVVPVRLAFIVPAGTNTFLNDLSALLEQPRPDATVAVHRIEAFAPDALADGIRRIAPAVQGLGIVAIDHPAVREALRAAATTTRILTLVSDIFDVPRLGYVGIDNRSAGRLAGMLLYRLIGSRRPAKVALFAGSLSYRGHEEREMGFRHILAEEARDLAVLELRELGDDAERGYQEAKTLLRDHPDLAGIYNIGAGNRGIARALEETGRARDVVFIGHELTEHTRRFLLSGTMDAVIDQNPRAEADLAIARLAAAVRGTAQPEHLPLVRIQVIFRENMPEP